jgi:hypothetical protein
MCYDCLAANETIAMASGAYALLSSVSPFGPLAVTDAERPRTRDPLPSRAPTALTHMSQDGLRMAAQRPLHSPNAVKEAAMGISDILGAGLLLAAGLVEASGEGESP